MRWLRTLVIGALLAGSCFTARAQDAIVLSGGSSRGLAHAGVLVGLEQRGYDPGLVIGVSMGAIVGALYATGYAPDSIWTLVEREGWREIFTRSPTAMGPHRTLRHAVLRLHVSPGGELSLRGFLPDARINRQLVRGLFPASARARGDFDGLARRYRSIAADLATGELVPLASGDLARAVRASMAAPGFFAPVRWGDRLLVDGVVSDYLPVAVAQELEANRVIAVDVLRPPARVASTDALQVSNRSLTLLLMQARSGTADVLIVPPIDPGLLPVVYPDDPRPLLQAGLAGTLEQLEPAAGPGRVRPRDLPPAPSSIGTLRIEEPEAALRDLVRGAFAFTTTEPYDPDAVLDAVDRLYATGLFDGVWPSVERPAAGAPAGAAASELVIRTEPVAPLALLGSAGYENDRGGRIWGSLRRRGAFAACPVEAVLEGFVDRLERWAAVSIQSPAPRPAAAWSAGLHRREYDVRLFEGGRDEAEVRRSGGWLGIEARRLDPERFGALTVHGEWIDAERGPSGASVGPELRLGAVPDLVPVLGLTPGLEAKLRVGEIAYWRAAARGSLERKWVGFAVAALADVATANRDAPLDEMPALGDDRLVPGLRWGKERGRTRAVAGVDLGVPIPRKGTARLRLRGGVITKPLVRAEPESWTGGAGLAGVWWTPYGRVEAGFEASTRGDRRVVVSLGADL